MRSFVYIKNMGRCNYSYYWATFSSSYFGACEWKIMANSDKARIYYSTFYHIYFIIMCKLTYYDI